jgi:hypothetical protein
MNAAAIEQGAYLAHGEGCQSRNRPAAAFRSRTFNALPDTTPVLAKFTTHQLATPGAPTDLPGNIVDASRPILGANHNWRWRSNRRDDAAPGRKFA